MRFAIDLSIGRASGLFFEVDDKVDAVVWNPVPNVSVTVYGQNVKISDIAAVARGLRVVDEATWKSKTKRVTRSFPARNGWSRCTSAS